MKALYERWTAISLPKRILGGMILGAVLGMMIPQAVGLSILGNLFVNNMQYTHPCCPYPPLRQSGVAKEDTGSMGGCTACC